jgi:hypothetical protein
MSQCSGRTVAPDLVELQLASTQKRKSKSDEQSEIPPRPEKLPNHSCTNLWVHFSNLQSYKVPEMAQSESTSCLYAEERQAFTIFKKYLPDPDINLWEQIVFEFTRFPELPTELRFMIWRWASFPARTFRLRCACNGFRPGIWDQDNLKKLHRPKNPVALQISTESRRETLRYYSVLFEHSWGSKIYFNPGVDRVIVRVGATARGPP